MMSQISESVAAISEAALQKNEDTVGDLWTKVLILQMELLVVHVLNL